MKSKNGKNDSVVFSKETLFRNRELAKEKEKCDELLQMMLPK